MILHWKISANICDIIYICNITYVQTYFAATVHLQLYFYSQKRNTGDRRIAEVLCPRSYFTVSSYNFLMELSNTENVLLHI